jgi:hypothetical protein
LYKYGLIFGIAILFLNQPVHAQQSELAIFTSQETYYYGDFLTFTIEVSEVTGELATLYIIDDHGKSSSPIPLGIEQQSITLTSPFPFESQVYPLGKYTLNIQYSNQEATVEFYLQDSGRIVIPLWIKDVGTMWTGGSISDETFATAIEYLINNDIIIIPETTSEQSSEQVSIPGWVKTNAEWWTQGMITDDDFAKGLQFLIKIGVIVV